MTTTYPITLRNEELSAQKDMRRFMQAVGSISIKLNGAEKMLNNLGNPLKGAALFARYCATLLEMPLTQSDFSRYCINPETGKPFAMFADNPIFPDHFSHMIETLGRRLDDAYINGILSIFRQAQGVAE